MAVEDYFLSKINISKVGFSKKLVNLYLITMNIAVVTIKNELCYEVEESR